MNLQFLRRLLSSVLVVLFALSPNLCYASETVTSETYTYDWREAEGELQEYMQDSSGSGSTTWTVTDDDVANGLVNASFYFVTRDGWVGKYASVPYSWTSPMEVPVFEFSSGYSDFNSFNTGVYGNGLGMYVILDTVDGSDIVDAGDAVNIRLTGLKHQMRYNYQWSWSQVNFGGGSGGGVAYYPLNTDKIFNITLEYVDNEGNIQQQSIKDSLVVNGDTFGIDANVQVPFDCTRLCIIFEFNNNPYNWSTPDASGYHSGAVHKAGTGIYLETAVYNGVLKITTPDETSGLLSGIIEWLKSIRDGIVNVANYVLELPSRIWTFIQEGLKMLFIPSEEDISNMHNQWDELMRDRFGAIYESGDIVHSFSQTMSVNSTMVADTGGVITMPSVTANLAGTNFTFGGYEVDLVPDGFQWLVTSLKMLINIVCTILFINSLKGKIEVLLR